MRGFRRVVAALALGLAGLGIMSIAVGLTINRREARVAPVDPAAHFTPEQRERADRYAVRKYTYWASATVLRWGALAAIAALGGGAALAGAGARLGRGRRFPSAFAAALLLLLFLSVLTLPLAWLSGYRTERAFGLTSQTPSAWLLDWAREQGFWLPIYAAVAAGFLAFVGRWPRRGWALAAGAGMLIAVAGVFLAPRIIDPLFYDFAPLSDQELARDIEELGHRAGIDVNRVLVMDASRRTTRLNAYVTGLGATRQVVLFDNLVVNAPREEVLSVVAHEIGHAAAHHVRKGVLLLLPVLALGAWLLAALARLQARERGLRDPGDPASLPLLWLALSLGLFFAAPALNGVRRAMEADADWTSLELTGDTETYVRTAERLTIANLMPAEPPRALVFWLYTHPPILHRLGMARYW